MASPPLQVSLVTHVTSAVPPVDAEIFTRSEEGGKEGGLVERLPLRSLLIALCYLALQFHERRRSASSSSADLPQRPRWEPSGQMHSKQPHSFQLRYCTDFSSLSTLTYSAISATAASIGSLDDTNVAYGVCQWEAIWQKRWLCVLVEYVPQLQEACCFPRQHSPLRLGSKFIGGFLTICQQ
jgi:hypothetical protein